MDETENFVNFIKGKFTEAEIKMAKFIRMYWKVMWRVFMRMPIMGIWFFQGWFICHIPRNMARSIQKGNWRI